MPTPDEVRSVIESYVRMMCSNDVDGIVDLYADGGTAEDPVGGKIQSGKDELRTFYAGTVPSLQVELTGPVRVAGNEAAFPMLAELTMNDNKLYLDVIDVMAFDDAGRITSMRAFWNPAEMRPNR